MAACGDLPPYEKGIRPHDDAPPQARIFELCVCVLPQYWGDTAWSSRAGAVPPAGRANTVSPERRFPDSHSAPCRASRLKENCSSTGWAGCAIRKTRVEKRSRAFPGLTPARPVPVRIAILMTEWPGVDGPVRTHSAATPTQTPPCRKCPEHLSPYDARCSCVLFQTRTGETLAGRTQDHRRLSKKSARSPQGWGRAKARDPTIVDATVGDALPNRSQGSLRSRGRDRAVISKMLRNTGMPEPGASHVLPVIAVMGISFITQEAAGALRDG